MGKGLATPWYGWKPDLPSVEDLPLSLKVQKRAKLPRCVNLSDKYAAIPVYNQGPIGSCTGQGNAEVHACAQISTYNRLIIEPSRLFIYYNERVQEGTVNYDSGAQIRTGIKSMVKQGVCAEADWPYKPEKFKLKPSPICYKNALKSQVLRYERVNNEDENAILSVLAEGFPIVFGFTVFESFESRKVSKSGLYYPNPKRERILGGHCTVLYGYNLDLEEPEVLIKNSWGKNWGLGGFFKMKLSDVSNPNMCDDFWLVRMVEDGN